MFHVLLKEQRLPYFLSAYVPGPADGKKASLFSLSNVPGFA